MKTAKAVIIVLIIVAANSVVYGQWSIRSWRGDSSRVANSVDLSALVESATDTTDTLAWLNVSSWHNLNLYMELTKGTTYWADSLGGDSLQFDIEGEVHYKTDGLPTGVGYWKDNATAPILLMSVVIGDTSHARYFRAISDSSLVPPGAHWLRLILKALPKHTRFRSYDLKTNIVIEEQS